MNQQEKKWLDIFLELLVERGASPDYKIEIDDFGFEKVVFMSRDVPMMWVSFLRGLSVGLKEHEPDCWGFNL